MQISQVCTNVLLKYNKITESQKAIYLYGFELLFSTISCILSILLLGAILGHMVQAIIFLIYFFPIRMAAGGYHAKSYRNCYLLTNGIAVVCGGLSEALWSYRTLKMEYLLWIGFFVALGIIWRKSPIIPLKYKNKTDRYVINRRYAHIILFVEMVLILVIHLAYNSSLVYTAIVTSFMVMLMMLIVKEGA